MRKCRYPFIGNLRHNACMVWMFLAWKWQYVNYSLQVHYAIFANSPNASNFQQRITKTYVTLSPGLEMPCLSLKIGFVTP